MIMAGGGDYQKVIREYADLTDDALFVFAVKWQLNATSSIVQEHFMSFRQRMLMVLPKYGRLLLIISEYMIMHLTGGC